MAGSSASDERKEGMPLWVKIQGVFLVLYILILVAMFTGIPAGLLLPGGAGHGIPGGGHGW